MKLKVQLEIHSLNNARQFEQNLSYQNLIKDLLFNKQQSNHDKVELLKVVSVEMINMKFKWIYVAMNWLIFLHQCLNLISENQQSNLSPSILLCFLNKIQNPKTLTKHEDYMLKKLFIPYLQYLIKLASIMQVKSERPIQTQNYIFLQLNLLRYAIAEFTQPIREFSRYFKQYYPKLRKCFEFIGKQVYKMHQRVAIHYEMKQLQQIHFIEVDQLSESLVFFPTQNQKYPKSNSTVASSDIQKHRESPILLKKISGFPDMQSTSAVFN